MFNSIRRSRDILYIIDNTICVSLSVSVCTPMSRIGSYSTQPRGTKLGTEARKQIEGRSQSTIELFSNAIHNVNPKTFKSNLKAPPSE